LVRKNYSVGLLDADVFGPSVPIMLDAEKYRPEVKRVNDTDIIIPLTSMVSGYFRQASLLTRLRQLYGEGLWLQVF